MLILCLQNYLIIFNCYKITEMISAHGFHVRSLKAEKLVLMRPVVEKAISANPGLKFNRLFILVSSA